MPTSAAGKRIPSPDDADALALTFAQLVAARPVYHDRTMYFVAMRDARLRRNETIHDYDPLEAALAEWEG